VTTFKYYVSNVSLLDENDTWRLIPESYLLVNAADSASLNQLLSNVPAGTYHGVRFTIGVDSARNFGGAQTGCLDPANGMFWSWNSGYIFLKFEGEFVASNDKKYSLTFHIGGITRLNNTLRTFTQKFDQNLKVRPDDKPRLELAANVAALFQGTTSISFDNIRSTMGGPNSVIVADNYAKGLFKVNSNRN